MFLHVLPCVACICALLHSHRPHRDVQGLFWRNVCICAQSVQAVDWDCAILHTVVQICTLAGCDISHVHICTLAAKTGWKHPRQIGLISSRIIGSDRSLRRVWSWVDWMIDLRLEFNLHLVHPFFVFLLFIQIFQKKHFSTEILSPKWCLMILLGGEVAIKGATIIIAFWVILLLLIIVLFLKAWLGREKFEDYNDIK